jgi:hypothetical protein
MVMIICVMKWSRDHVLTWGFMINVDFTDLLTVIEFKRSETQIGSHNK